MNGLVVADVQKSFGGRQVLRGIELSVGRGEVHVIIGPNASGKSTLLNVIDGQLVCDVGSVAVDGAPVSSAAAHARQRLGICRSFQVPQLMSTLTVAEHVSLALTQRSSLLGGLIPSLSLIAENVWTQLGQAGLRESANMRAEQLSQSDKKLLDLLMAMVGQPKVLLLDEPTAGLDSRATETLLALLQKLVPDAAVLVVEHDLDFVRRLDCTVSLLYQGQVALTGALDEILKNSLTQDVYLHG